LTMEVIMGDSGNDRVDKAAAALERAVESIDRATAAMAMFAESAGKVAAAAGDLMDAINTSHEGAVKAIAANLKRSAETRDLVRARMRELDNGAPGGDAGQGTG